MTRPATSSPRQLSSLLLALFALWVSACSERALTFGERLEAGDPVRGFQRMMALQCARCHSPRPAVDRTQCLGCHTAIAEGRAAALPLRAEMETLEGWQSRIWHYREVPSLVGVGRLLKREWLVQFLLEPHDLRPRLSESMPRLPLSEQDALDIASALAAAQPTDPYFADRAIADFRRPLPPLTAGDRARGRALFEDRGCGTCHAFTGAVVAPPLHADRLEARKLQLAVDLRHTRHRFIEEEVVPWLLDPSHRKPDAVMPNLDLTYQEARDLAAFVIDEPLEATAPPEPIARLPLLERRVTYTEVNERIFGRTCVHCHDDTGLGLLGDGGPGNVGGFGFPARGLSFADYESVLSGYLDDAGQRRSLFERDADDVPLLVRVLLLRRDEEASLSDPQEPQRGMPLSLPAVTAEELQLVESWIAQGRPR
ncbi:MAG: c-type cytochrome [Myxococcales bacterium]|nr:c-type cytochrome [Myxococcales bacterium]